MQVLQEFFLQDLQDLALNLARLALKMKLFLQELKNFARTCKKKLQDMIKKNLIILLSFLKSSCKISARFFNSCKKSFIFSASLARFKARSSKSCKKNTCEACVFLARWFLLGTYKSHA